MDNGERNLAHILGARVPGLPDDLFDEPDARLSDRLAHGQLQALRLAVTTLRPDLQRDALETADLTAGDLAYWLESIGVDTDGGRLTRGEYHSPTVFLRGVVDADVRQLYDASFTPESAHLWRFRGRTMAPEVFRSALFSDAVLAQFVVAQQGSGTGIALVSAYAADLVAGHASVAVQRFASRDDTGHGRSIEGFLLFVQYVFDHFAVRKLYLEIPSYNEYLVRQLSDSFVRLEGRLIGHFYYRDELHDQLIYAIYRADWDEIATHYFD